MTTASIPPEKLVMYGALAIAGYWFVTKKAGAMPRMSTKQAAKYKLGSRPPAAGDAAGGYASTDAKLWNSVNGIFGKLLDGTQTTVNNAIKRNPDGSFSNYGYEGNAPDVYGRETLRNSEKGGGYYGGSPGDTYGGGGEGNYGRQAVIDSEGSGYYGSANDGTVINPAPAFGSVYDAASAGDYRWDPGY